MFSKLLNKKIAFIQEFTTHNLSLELEPGWCEYLEMNNATKGFPLSFMRRKGGVGVLQVSFVTSQKEQQFEIIKHLKRNNKSNVLGLKEYRIRDWTVYEYDEKSDGKYCKAFNFVKPHIVAYLTYMVSTKHLKEKELHEAITIAHSLEINSRL